MYMDAARKAIEMLYKDTCTIYEKQKVIDPITHTTTFKEVAVHENIKCRLSFSSISVVGNEEAPSKAQTTKLFIAPEIDIKPGSKISINRQGKTLDYKRSGEPAIYSNHQEIMLDLFERYA